MTIPKLLSTQLLTALQTVLGEGLPVDFAPAVTPSQDLRFGDYQSNAAMMLAKQARMNPRALATEVVEKFGESEIASLEIAGPGFINFRIKPEYLAAPLLMLPRVPALGKKQKNFIKGEMQVCKRQTCVNGCPVSFVWC